MERFRRNRKLAAQKTGNSKSVNLLGAVALTFLLVGCGTQKTDLPEEPVAESETVHGEGAWEVDRQTYKTEGSADILSEDQAKQIIVEADNALHTVMEKADVYNREQPEETEVRAFLSDFFDQSILDYVLYVYQIKTEEGKCFYQYYDHYRNFYMDTEESMQITEQGESYCNINVSFVHRWEREWDEETVTVRLEKNSNGRWIITKMNQWYNDFRFYYMREMDDEPVYLTRDMAEWMIREFGTDENGGRVQISVRADKDGYILPDSSERRLMEHENHMLSRYEAFLAVQEIYARNGKKFDDVMLYEYFRKRPWYEPYKEVFDENSLSETERYNISQLAAAGNLGELAQAAYGNRYGKEEKMPGQPLSAEEASCIIGDAFDSLGEVFVAKDENKIDEISDDVEEYYSLGEYSLEEQLKEYVATWFSEETFDYLMNMCFIMHGVVRDEDGKYMLMRGLTLPMNQYVVDDFAIIVIKEYTDVECTVSVPFQNLNGWPGDMSTYSEGKMVLRREGNRWIITEISEPHYDFGDLRIEADEEKEKKPQSDEKSSSDNDIAYKKGEFDKYGQQYSLIEIEEGEYEVTLYDKENKVVHTETFTKLPWISEMTDNILQIGLSLGSPAPYIYYYDKERAIVSTCYPDSFYLKDNYVAYMRDVNTLIVTDIFEDNELYMEISRNFSDSQNLGGLYLAIKDITWITLKGRDVLVLEYHEGEDRELLSEVIPIENGEEAVVYNELDELEKEYDILEYDICSPVLYDFERVHPTIKAHAEYEMRNHEEICQKYGKQLKISLDYHTFDFDDDGLDDYLLCVDRELYDGRVEHWIEIYVTKRQRGYVFATQKMEDEIVSSVLEVNLPQTDQMEDDGHKQIVVLNEKTEGYYAIALPWSNLILKYDDRYSQYEFCDQ